MALGRACLVIVLLVFIDSVTSKPFFDLFGICDFFCDYDDDSSSSTTTSTSSEDDFCTCTTRRRRTTTPMPLPTTPMMAAQSPTVQGFNMSIQPGSGMNLLMTNNGALWNMMISPFSGPSGAGGATATTTASSVTTTVARTTSAGATTAAPAATTAAPGATTAAPGATTAAPGATTAAPAATTAAAGK